MRCNGKVSGTHDQMLNVPKTSAHDLHSLCTRRENVTVSIICTPNHVYVTYLKPCWIRKMDCSPLGRIWYLIQSFLILSAPDHIEFPRRVSNLFRAETRGCIAAVSFRFHLVFLPFVFPFKLIWPSNVISASDRVVKDKNNDFKKHFADWIHVMLGF